MKDGHYDENESHKGFIEALNAWRNDGNKEGASTVKITKKIKFLDVQ